MAKSKSGGGNAKKEILHRVRVLYFIFIVFGFGIAARLVWVQMFSDSVEHNANVLKNGIVRKVKIPAHRGAILTRDGEPLAMSSLRYNATFDFASDGIREASDEVYMQSVDSLSKLLAQHFSPSDAEAAKYDYISANEYRDMFIKYRAEGKARAKKILPRAVTLDEWNMMCSKFPIMNNNLGVVCNKDRVDERIHPAGELAHQVIGICDTIIVNNDTIPGTGIERIYGRYLNGVDGRAMEQYIAHGFWSRINDPYNKQPEDGCDVVTTLDGALQRAATETLRHYLKEYRGSWGVAMVMEVATGDILAMVNLGATDRRGGKYSEKVNNHALRSSMSPGSTFKLAAAMALVENCGYNISSSMKIPNNVQKVGRKTTTDTHIIRDDKTRKPLVDISLKTGFAHSSNIYFASAIYNSYRNNPSSYTDYLERLTFRGTVGLDEYGEKPANLPEPNSREWKELHGHIDLSLPYLGYGYIVEVPPIHTLTFYNGVMNNGRMVAPRLVDRIERNGEVVERMPHVTLVDSMCSPQTLKVLYECLDAAATPERTLRKFADLPFKIKCKTGTAQVSGDFVSEAVEDIKDMNKRGGIVKDDGYYLGSIVCAMPQEAPKYTIMVAMMKQKEKNDPFGISLAGDPAHDIMEYLYINDPSLHAAIESAPTPYSPNNIKGGNSAAIEIVSSRLSAFKSGGSTTEWGTATTDVGGNVSIATLEVVEGKVPDVRNMGLSDALYLLESLQMSVTHSGKGRIVKQSAEPGSDLEACGYTIHLTLEP